MNWSAAALRYARAGFRVLPVRFRGKEPLLPHGVKDATADARVIARWATRWPEANLAIAVDEPLRVLDVDPRNGGDVALSELLAEHGALPKTPTARTGSGGAHYLLRVPRGSKTRGKVGAGLDLLGPGRYFLVAPSVHPCGGVYSWTSPRTPIAPMPGWLLARALRVEPPPSTAPAIRTPDAYARAERYMAKVAPAISGSGGHSHTFIVAQRLVRGFALSDEEAFALLVVWNVGNQPPWSQAELRRKIREARVHGAMRPGDMLERRRAS